MDMLIWALLMLGLGGIAGFYAGHSHGLTPRKTGWVGNVAVFVGLGCLYLVMAYADPRALAVMLLIGGFFMGTTISTEMRHPPTD